MSAPSPLPLASDRYDRADQDRTRGALQQRLSALEQRPSTHHISADRGDADVTLNADTDVPIQRFATALSANRTVTLGTGFFGAWFHITRSGLGAFTLNVGGLKTLPSATAAWATVGHDGAAWYLVAQGVL